MNQFKDFFVQLFDASDCPQYWHSGKWTAFNRLLYIMSGLLMLTASNETPFIQKCYKPGANSHIIKLVNFETLPRLKNLAFTDCFSTGLNKIRSLNEK